MQLKQTIVMAGTLVLLTAASTARAAMYSETFGSDLANGGVIPDATALGPSAWSDTRTISGPIGGLDNVAVTLNLQGGYNGDLYAYLTHNNQTLVLLNRVGVGEQGQTVYGFATSGMTNVRLADSGVTSIHTEPNPIPYVAYKPDSSLATFAAFDGGPADGAWTLFFSDMSQGGVSKVTSWELSFDLAAVPEPVNMALAGFGVLAAGVVAWRKYRAK